MFYPPLLSIILPLSNMRGKGQRLAGLGPHHHARGMLVVTEAILPLSAQPSIVEASGRLFPGITDTAQARDCARTITA
jgi:hypothetical protein